MDSVNELSSWVTTVSFTDEDGLAVMPASAYYQIDDIGSGTAVRAETEITALGEEVQIRWESADTLIIDESLPYETRRMTVRWTYASLESPALELDGRAEYLLQVKNLAGVSSPSPA